MKHRALILLAAVFAALTAAGAARSDVLSMDKAIEEAYANNPALKAAAQKELSAASGVSLAKSGLSPRFSVSEMVTSTNNPTYSFMATLNQQEFTPAMMGSVNDPDVTTNFNTRLSFMYPLSTGGYVPAGIRAAMNAGEATAFEIERTRQAIRFNVRTAYLRVIIAEKKVLVANKALETVKEHAAITDNMYKTGMIVESDRLSAGVRVAEIEQMLIQSTNDASLARSALLMAMGVPQDRVFEIDASALDKMTLDGDSASFIKAALEKRPELKALDAAVKAKTEMISMSAASKKPQVFAMGNYDMDNSSLFNHNGESWFMGVGVNLNVSDGGESKSRAGQARAGVDEMKWQREQLRQGIELEVRHAYMNVEAAAKGMEVMKRAEEQSEASYKIIENRYKNGLAINVEVLAAETARTQAQTAVLGAAYQYAVGIETLRFAMGDN